MMENGKDSSQTILVKANIIQEVNQEEDEIIFQLKDSIKAD